MGKSKSPGRAGSPISLKPLTLKEALRRAMQVPPPDDEPKRSKKVPKVVTKPQKRKK